MTMGRRLLPILTLLLLSTACTRDGGEVAMSGYAEAELVYVAPAIGGTLQSLAVRRGDRVQRGQPLFALDADAEDHGRAAALARSERAQAQEANLRKGRRPLELRAIEQQLAQAEAALSASDSSLRRQQQLVAQGFVAPIRLEELVAARDRDAARVREMQAQRAFAAEAARADEIAAAAAEARGSAADLDLARWRSEQKRRSAPADGLVYDTIYREGEWVAAGMPVVVLLPPGALKLRFFVPEASLPRAAVGRALRLDCDGCPAGLSARIRYVAPQAEFTPPVIYSETARAKLVFLAEAELPAGTPLKPGQPVDVRFAGDGP
jgi:HlyD family secretion protein